MLRLLLISLTLLLISACTENKIILQTEPAKLEALTIIKIPIPHREQGYSNFETTVITTEAQLDAFVAKIKKEKNWNNKTNFLEALLLHPTDFKTYNILLYRITEASGSTILSVHSPQGNAEHIIITVGRDKKSVGTTNIAHYALAYKIKKSVKDISFDNGLKKELIQNQKNIKISKEETIPKDCIEWNDGCNDCHRVEEEIVCTERICYRKGPFKCKKWK